MRDCQRGYGCCIVYMIRLIETDSTLSKKRGKHDVIATEASFHILPAPTPNNNMSMITAASWVPRGFAAPMPTRYNLDEKELKRIEELAKLRLNDATEELEEAQRREEGEEEDDDEKEDTVMSQSTKSKKGKKSQSK